MKKQWFLVSCLISVCMLVAALVIPASANPEDQFIPESINGLPVIFVQTPANTVTLPEGTRIIVVMDNLSSSKEESVQRFRTTIDSVKAMLPPGDMIEVYGGPGVSKEQYIKIHDENDAFWREHGPLEIGPPPSDVQAKGVTDTATVTVVDKSYAIFTNDDPSSSRTVQGIYAHMSGIAVGTSQNNFSAFLVNGMTNVSNYQFQSGQAYYSNGVAKQVFWDAGVELPGCFMLSEGF